MDTHLVRLLALIFQVGVILLAARKHGDGDELCELVGLEPLTALETERCAHLVHIQIHHLVLQVHNELLGDALEFVLIRWAAELLVLEMLVGHLILRNETHVGLVSLHRLERLILHV